MDGAFYNVDWSNCTSSCDEVNLTWDWMAGMNGTGTPKVKRKDISITMNGTLEIHNVQLSDAGRYMCTVNRIGYRSPRVYFTALIVKDQPKSVLNQTVSPTKTESSPPPSNEGVQTAKPSEAKPSEDATGIPTMKKPAAASDKPTGYVVAIFVLLVLLVLCVGYIIKRKYDDYRGRNEQNPSVTVQFQPSFVVHGD
ncbi:hypothetical protein ACROYT_G027918 [Oculina patagonica]